MTEPLLIPAASAAVSSTQELVEGNADSKVRVVVYEDLQCSDCTAFHRIMDESLLPRYAAEVAFVHKDFPLPRHTWARQAAIAARFFEDRKPELGLAYRRHILAAIRETTPENFEDRLRSFAEQNGLPAAEAVAALVDGTYVERVEKDYQEGVARGVAKTPTVFVNGAAFIERFSLEEISKGIDQALAETR